MLPGKKFSKAVQKCVQPNRNRHCLESGLSPGDKRQEQYLCAGKIQRKEAEVGIQHTGGEAGRGWWHRMERADVQMRSTWREVPDMELGSHLSPPLASILGSRLE